MEAILLSGDQASLPRAELQALLDVHGGRIRGHATARLAVLDGGSAAASRVVQAWGWGDLWGEAGDDEAGLASLVDAVAQHAPGRGSAAVRALRYGRDKSPNRAAVERALGDALGRRGHIIDLEAPDVEVFAWLGDGRITVGHLRDVRPSGFDDRAVERRRHFHPVSLHPRRAASLVHLARVPPGGTVYDPFCGTGGIVLETALLGFRARGSDIDDRMVQGTWQTLTDAGPAALDGEVFTADVGATPALVGQVDGIVTDLPYGTASSTHQEPIRDLYRRAFAAFAELLPADRFAVVGHRDAGLLELAAGQGLEVHRPAGHGTGEVYEEYVHKNLTRRYAVLRKA